MKTFRLCLAIGGLFLLSQDAFAQYTLKYSTNGSVITVTGFSGNPVNVIIPDFATSIGSGTFNNNLNLASVTIGDGVTTIGMEAFVSCPRLTNVTFGTNVSSIGGQTFQGCVVLTNVIFPNSVTNIGELAFNYCTALTNINIPNNVTSIGEGAFTGCTNLTAITVSAQNTNFSSVNGVLFYQNQSLLVEFPGALKGSYTIPSSVTSIGVNAFAFCPSSPLKKSYN